MDKVAKTTNMTKVSNVTKKTLKTFIDTLPYNEKGIAYC